MTENKRFTMDNPNDWGFPITDNVTGKVYNCASNILMKELCVDVNTIVEENEQLKLTNRLLLEEMKEIRDKLTVYLEIRKGDLND